MVVDAKNRGRLLLRGRRTEGFVSLAVVGALGGAMTLGLVGAGSPLHSGRLVDDVVWVFGFDHGRAVAHHVDLASGTVDVQEKLPSTYGEGTHLVQADGVTYVADHGQLQTLDLGQADQVLTAAAVRLPAPSLYPVEDESGTSAWFIDGAAGTAIPVDTDASGLPITGPPVKLGAPVDTSSAAPAGIDRNGQLWVALAHGGRAVGVTVTRHASAGSGAILTGRITSHIAVANSGDPAVSITVVSGQAYAVDSTDGRLVRLGSGSGAGLVPIPPGAVVSPRQGQLTDPRATTVLAMTRTSDGARILAIDLKNGRLVRSVNVRSSNAAHILPPYPVGDNALIVDPTAAEAELVNLRTGRIQQQRVAQPGQSIQVEARNGLVAVSSPAAPTGVVVNDNGFSTFALTPPPAKPQPHPRPTPPPPPVAPPARHIVPVATPSKPGPLTSPRNVDATGGKESATVSWLPPARQGAGLAGYDIADVHGGAMQHVASGATSVVIAGLTDGTSYTFQVRANDSSGQQSAWVSAPPVTPESQVPDAPQGVTATPGDQSVQVRWSPVNANGTTVTKYVVYWSATSPSGAQTGGRQDVTNPAATSTSITGLTNGDSVTVEMQTFATANGRQVTSAKSTPTNAVTPYGAPGTPQVTPQSQDGSFVVQWSADPNGAPITGIQIDYSDGTTSKSVQASSPGASGSQQFPGTNGTTYTVTVTATNKGGSTMSAAQQVKPAGAPVVSLSNPRSGGDRAIAADLSVNWNGSTPGSCHLVIPGVSDVVGACNTIAIGGLMYHTTYSFYAYVVSTDKGNSQNSNTGSATTNDWATAIYDTKNGYAQMWTCDNFSSCAKNGTITSGSPVSVDCWARGSNYTYYNNGTAQATFNLWIRLSDGRWTYEVEVKDSSYNNQPNGSLPAC